MNKVKLLITISFFFALLGCSTSLNVSNINESNFSCVKPKRDMYLLMSYNVCPLFGMAPKQQNLYWKLRVNNGRYTKSDFLIRSEVGKIRDCDYKKTFAILPLDSSDTLTVTSIEIRNDTKSSNRLMLKGKYLHEDEILEWSTEVLGQKDSSVEDRILSTYSLCEAH